jgi:hypothetical protein
MVHCNFVAGQCVEELYMWPVFLDMMVILVPLPEELMVI